MLIRAGLPRRKAADFVVARLSDLGVHRIGSVEITPQRVLRWRAEIGDSGSAGAKHEYDSLVQELALSPDVRPELESTKAAVARLLTLVPHWDSG